MDEPSAFMDFCLNSNVIPPKPFFCLTVAIPVGIFTLKDTQSPPFVVPPGGNFSALYRNYDLQPEYYEKHVKTPKRALLTSAQYPLFRATDTQELAQNLVKSILLLFFINLTRDIAEKALFLPARIFEPENLDQKRKGVLTPFSKLK